MDGLVKDLCDIYITTAKNIGIYKEPTYIKHHIKTTKTNHKNNKPWFNEECRTKRTEYLRAKGRLKKIKSDETKAELRKMASGYKSDMPSSEGPKGVD